LLWLCGAGGSQKKSALKPARQNATVFYNYITFLAGAQPLVAVVAIKTLDGYKTTNAFFIGDRIAPQSTYIDAAAMELRVNYAERKPDEPIGVGPSVGWS